MPDNADLASERQSLLKIAHHRLYPSLTDPNFLVLRSRRKILERWIQKLPPSGLRILDVGGRYQPYRPLFHPRVERYVACDIERTVLVDVVAGGELLPFAAESFDVVIATQVFDCFQDPQRAAGQMYGVLKKGGYLVSSMPGLAPPFHERELWRFTRSGLAALFSAFREVTIIPETTSFSGLLRTANLALLSFPFRSVRQVLRYSVCPCLNLAGLAARGSEPDAAPQFAANYSVIARK